MIILGSEIQSARAFVYTLEPARLHAFETALTLDEIVPAHVDRAIIVTKSDSTAFPEEDDADEKEKEKEKKGGEDDQEGEKNEQGVICGFSTTRLVGRLVRVNDGKNSRSCRVGRC